MNKLKLRCYVCGEDAGKEFVLWSLTDIVDRGFVCCVLCVGRLKDNPFILRVLSKYGK